jgi:hypothetical protein
MLSKKLFAQLWLHSNLVSLIMAASYYYFGALPTIKSYWFLLFNILFFSSLFYFIICCIAIFFIKKLNFKVVQFSYGTMCSTSSLNFIFTVGFTIFSILVLRSSLYCCNLFTF